MEVMVKGSFVGATCRTVKGKDGGPDRKFADLHMAVAMRQGPGAVGQEATSFRMEPALFEKLKALSVFSPVVVYCEESQYTREGGTVETVKVAVEVQAEKAK